MVVVAAGCVVGGEVVGGVVVLLVGVYSTATTVVKLL